MVAGDDQLRQTTMVSLASIVRTACIDRHSSSLRFPVLYYGQFCAAGLRDSVPRQLVQLLGRYVDAPGPATKANTNGDRMAALSALNILGHASMIPLVVPIIEGKVTRT